MDSSVANLRIQPFIVTLASMIGIRGLASRLTNNTNIDFGFGSDAGSVFARLVSEKSTVVTIFVIVFAGFLRAPFANGIRAASASDRRQPYRRRLRRIADPANQDLCVHLVRHYWLDLPE